MQRVNCKTLLSALIVLIIACDLHATPVAASEGSAVAEPGLQDGQGSGSARILDKAVSTEIPGGTSRTLDMLLELQGKAPAHPAQVPSERSGGRDQPGRPVSIPPVSTGPHVQGASSPSGSAAGPAEGVFGAGAPFMANAKERLGLGTDAQTAQGHRSLRPADAFGAYGTQRSDSGADNAGHSLVPRHFIQWIREHRALVVGSAAGILAGMWGASVYRSRRRR